jgi:hypothetical protein
MLLAGGITVGAALLGSGSAGDGRSETPPQPTVRVTNRSPLVSFDLFEPSENGRIPALPPTPAFSSSPDRNGVVETVVGAHRARHIAIISAQASGMENSDLDMGAALRKTPSLTPSEQAALTWLRENAIDIGGGAIVWHYTFDHTFNNMIIKSGWPSAFAQADVLKALLLAYRKTLDKSYLDLAIRAGYAFGVPCEAGGLRCEVGGVPWFAEVPVPYGYASMILNGHLYAVVMLHRLYQLDRDQRIGQAYREGMASAERLILRYDTGYWSIYQLRPRERDILLSLGPAATSTEIHQVSLSSPVSRPSTIGFGKEGGSTYPGNQTSTAGWGGISDWGRELQNVATLTIQPGRLTVNHDPVHIGGFDVAIDYKSPECVPPVLATYDYRAKSSGYMKVPPIGVTASLDGCSARYAMATAITPWAQIDEFYHDWHTRLVTELWRSSGSPKLYATAVRWRQYMAAARRLEPDKTHNVIFTPVFDPTESPEDDAEITEALHGVDPATLSEEDVSGALQEWIRRKCLPEQKAKTLLARAGIASQDGPASACAGTEAITVPKASTPAAPVTPR